MFLFPFLDSKRWRFQFRQEPHSLAWPFNPPPFPHYTSCHITNHHAPCHAPTPCTAQLAHQPKPKSDPTQPSGNRTTWYCCWIFIFYLFVCILTLSKSKRILSVYLSLSFSDFIFLSLFLSATLSLSFWIQLYLSLSMSLSPSLSLPLYLSRSGFIGLSLSPQHPSLGQADVLCPHSSLKCSKKFYTFHHISKIRNSIRNLNSFNLLPDYCLKTKYFSWLCFKKIKS